MKTDCKGRMLAAVSTVKLEPWSANECSDKYVLVENSGRLNSRFKILKSYMFITMCQMISSSYVQHIYQPSLILTIRPLHPEMLFCLL